MVVVSNFDRGLGLEEESLVLLSSSNSASLGHLMSLEMGQNKLIGPGER